ncbi:hypothetical protein IQ250_22640, partial [Pseudanabaenaceae cyanobacterium LEGE 13415]|nr:hypothetical protein [Pseudanabaenaceae cyanobacterium LEGE 13415]
MKAQLSLPSKILLTLCLVLVLVSVNWVAINSHRTTHLKLDCGEPQGESYILGQAIAKVIHENNPKITLSVV